jgi:NAD(P)-dependent dehydrogenase (short-subunit alcohol dehydrogenase family)
MRYYQADIAQIGEHAVLLARIVADLGPLTCLVNSAGVTSLKRGDMLGLSPESFDRLLGINLRGTFFLTQAVARHMLDCRPAANVPRTIITIGSANAEIVGENRADYCMAKAALAMMSKLFAARLASAGIAVFEIRPGIIHTAMTLPAAARYDQFIADGGVPMNRWGEPDDVAATVVTLARGDIPYATGIHLDIGGGMQLHRV